MNYVPKKIDLKPKRHHGFHAVLMVMGWLLPPLAIAVRFGIGIDFFINVILTICGYFPGHFHNFYCQNIRNNSNRGRTPKWAKKAGLVDDSDAIRRAKKNQWAKRYDERNNQSTHIGQDLEEGEIGDNYVPVSEQERERERRREREGLWNDTEDTEYYNEDQAPNQRHWHYPANFEGSATGTGKKKLGFSNKGDRWERSRASRPESTSSDSTYPAANPDDDVPEWGRDYGSKRRSSKNKRKPSNNNFRADGNGYGNGNGNGYGGGGYADDIGREDGWGSGGGQQQPKKQSNDPFDHQF